MSEPTLLDVPVSTGPARRRRRAAPARHTWSLRAFGAAWCPPWPLLAEALTKLTATGVKVELIDVDADLGAAERHRIVTLPTIVVLRDGTERRRITGAISPAELADLVARD